MGINYNNHSFAVIGNKLYAWGANSYGQLGTGDNAVKMLPVELTIPFSVSEIVKCIWTGRFSLLLRNNGEVWGSGVDTNGELGGIGVKNVFTKLPSQYFSGVQDIKCYDYSAIMKKDDGKWYGWGYSATGVFSDNIASGNYIVPIMIPEIPNEEVEDMFIGTEHIFALTKKKNLYGRGTQAYVGTSEVSTKFVKIGLTNVSDFVVGYQTFAAKSNEEWYGWGYNSGGELGLGHRNIVSLPLKMMDNLELPVFSSISTGFFKMKDGSWFGCGWNLNGQLGLGNTKNDIYYPIPIPHLSDVVELRPFQYGCISKKVVDGNAEFYGWGANGWGQLGLGNIQDPKVTPMKIDSISMATEIFGIKIQKPVIQKFLIKDSTTQLWTVAEGELKKV